MPNHKAKFPKGEKMTVDEVAAVVGDAFKEMNENPPESVLKVREQMEGKVARQRLTWKRAFPNTKVASWKDDLIAEIRADYDRGAITSSERSELILSVKKAESKKEAEKVLASHRKMRTAATGLYGFNKATQLACEAASRKLARAALRIAKNAFAKDANVVPFLQTHVKRENSKSARVLLAAMKEIGPKLASARAASSVTRRRLNPTEMQDVTSGIKRRRNTQIGQTPYKVGQRYKLNGDDYIIYDADLVGSDIQLVLLSRDGKEMVSGLSAGLQSATFKEVPRPWDDNLSKIANAPEYGLYGFRTRTADIGLEACKEVRTAAGRITADLHRRKADLHDKFTGFWKEHFKQAKCAYAGILLSCYPDATMKYATRGIVGSVLPHTNRFVHSSKDLRTKSGFIIDAQVLPSELSMFRNQVVATFGRALPLTLGSYKEAHVSSFVNEDGRTRDVEGTLVLNAHDGDNVVASANVKFTGIYTDGPMLTVLASGDFLEWEE